MVQLRVRNGALEVSHRGLGYDVIGRERLGLTPLWVKPLREGKESLWLGGGEGGDFLVEVDDEGEAFRIDVKRYPLPFTPEDGALFVVGPVVWGERKVAILSPKGRVVDVGPIKAVFVKEGRGVVVGEKLLLVLGERMSGISAERVGNMGKGKATFAERQGTPVVELQEGSKVVVIALGGEKEGYFAFKEHKKGAFQRFKE